jgi:hypothetical protein
MMFRVRWEASAVQELTTSWIEADSPTRKAITAASYLIDQRLQSDPYGAGESRPGGRRIDFIYPLGFLFQIEEDEETVSVLHVWRVRPRTA